MANRLAARALATVAKNLSTAQRMERSPATQRRIAAIGDLHVSKSSQGRFQPLPGQISSAADVLPLCGGFTDYGTPDEARILRRELSAPVTIPVIGLLGHHDRAAGR